MGRKERSLVSVVITTYGQPERLKKALQSVLNQTYEKLEIIVVDGANDENCEKITEENNVKYIGIRNDIGVQHARNIGCKTAGGKYIAMLDDDDLWEPNKIEEQVKQFKDEYVALVTCFTKIKNNKESIFDKPPPRPDYNYLLQSFNYSSTSTYVFKKSILKEIGYFDEDLIGMHEYDLALKIAREGYKIYTVPHAMMIRSRDTKYGGRKHYHVKIAEVLEFWNNWGDEFIMQIGWKRFFLNAVKTIGLISAYLLSYLIKDRVWDIIYPIKSKIGG